MLDLAPVLDLTPVINELLNWGPLPFQLDCYLRILKSQTFKHVRVCTSHTSGCVSLKYKCTIVKFS